MKSFQAWQSTARINTLIQARSRSFWVALLIALIGVRFWIPRQDGTAITIAIHQHLPAMTSAVLGTCLGTVVTIFLLPLGFIYLRSSATNREPWQVMDVAPAARLSMALGSFAADVWILSLFLVALTLAGWVIAWTVLRFQDSHIWQITYALWIGSLPALMCVAAFKQLLSASRWTRSWLGEAVYFVAWIYSLTYPLLPAKTLTSFQREMTDFTGYLQPIMDAAHAQYAIQIGFGMPYQPGTVLLDMWPALHSRQYLLSRIAWAAASVLLVAVAAALYSPRKTRKDKGTIPEPSRRTLASGKPYVPVRVPFSRWPIGELIWNNLTLLYRSRGTWIASVLVAFVGVFTDFRHVTSPALLATQLLGLTSLAGANEAMARLTTITATAAWTRRFAFIVAGTMCNLVLSLPAIAFRAQWHWLGFEVLVGCTVYLIATALSLLTRSPFAARLILFVLWYGYTSS